MNIFNIPIITYHKISSEKEFGVTTITPDTFKKQLKLLAENGFETITFRQFSVIEQLPDKPIIISFDDTYKSIYENAFPIMKDFNFKGVLFIISDFIGKINLWEAYPIQRKHYHANENEIKEMLENSFEIGSHCKTHKFLPHLSWEEIQSELVESKQTLEIIFDTDIITCCYPYGGYNKKVIKVALAASYRYGVRNLRYFSAEFDDLLCLQRRSIYSTDSLSTFQKKITSSSKFNFNFVAEWLIQKGAYAGILKNKLI